jgi:hypothetical protein
MGKNVVLNRKLERYQLDELPMRELDDIRVFEGMRGGV